MAETRDLTRSIYEGWHEYQSALINALRSLEGDQLALRAAAHLRSVGEITRHIVGARARWFQSLVGDKSEEFGAIGKWDREDAAEDRTAEDLISALEMTWLGIKGAIDRWSPEEWEEVYAGEDSTEPEAYTRHWVIWHLVEHDLHHGGEISLTLGVHGVPAVER